MTKQESQTIDQLRVPMAFFIICIHMQSYFPYVEVAPSAISSWRTLYEMAYVLCTEHLACLAMPMFFAFSGFLLFQNLQQWSKDVYLGKLRNRVRSLILPYLLWNVMYILLTVVKYCYLAIRHVSTWQELADWYVSHHGFMHMLWDCYVSSSGKVDWLGFAVCSYMPIHMPLWFMRDLIVLLLFAPVIYWCIRKFPTLTIALIFFCRISHIWIHWPGFSAYSTFYFSLGALAAIHNLNVVKWSGRYVWILLGTSLVLLYSLMYHYAIMGGALFSVVKILYKVLGILTVLGATGLMIERVSWRLPAVATQSSFFVYVTHALPVFILYSPIAMICRIEKWVMGGPSDSLLLLRYLMAPLLTLALCMAIYALLMRYCPTITAVLVGNRTTSKHTSK